LEHRHRRAIMAADAIGDDDVADRLLGVAGA